MNAWLKKVFGLKREILAECPHCGGRRCSSVARTYEKPLWYCHACKYGGYWPPSENPTFRLDSRREARRRRRRAAQLEG